MSINRKGFIHYCRVGVNDSLNTDLSTSDLLLDKFDKEIFQNCRFSSLLLKYGFLIYGSS